MEGEILVPASVYEKRLSKQNSVRRSKNRRVSLKDVWSGEQDLNLRQLGICGLGRLE